MSVAIDFERTLLQLLKDDQKSRENNIFPANNTIKIYEESEKCESGKYDYEKFKYQNDTYEQAFTVAPAVSLFAGICIGVGLASHSLITQWK